MYLSKIGILEINERSLSIPVHDVAISQKIIHCGLINDKAVLVGVIAWCRTHVKPSTDDRHMNASLGPGEIWLSVNADYFLLSLISTGMSDNGGAV